LVREKTTSSLLAEVATHKLKKSEWKWPSLVKDILIMGTGCLSSISFSTKEDSQIEHYLGIRFQNFTRMGYAEEG